MKYIDIHCHLSARHDFAVGESGGDFIDQGNLEEILLHMKEKEVGAITIGTDLESSKKAIEIAEANNNVWACIGVHPEGETGFDENEFEEMVKSPKVVGIGECGLEYFVMKKEETEKYQKELFIKQIRFAIKHDKPLMLHIRSSSRDSFDAYEDALGMLENYKKEFGDRLRGNVHFFAGDVSIAQKFLDLGFTLSFTGVITFTHDYDEVIKYIPQDWVMSETDAPWVAPVPWRGQRNEPAYVIEVIKKMAEIRGEDLETLNKAIIQNAKKVFLLS